MSGNNIRTVVLLGLLTGVLIGIGGLAGGPNGLLFGLIFAIAMNFGAYWFSDKMVLRMHGAKEATDVDYPQLNRVVAEVAHLANLPKPKVYVMETMSANAFATGRNPKHAAIAVTQGIMKILSPDELKGVIAHEMAHIKNRDILISTIAATIAGVISYMAVVARWGAIFGGFGRSDNNGSGIFELLVIAIVAPLMAVVIQMAISRSREFEADKIGANFIHNPIALANALTKLDRASAVAPMKKGSEATAHMFIVNPFSGSNMMKLLSTHPSTKDRVNKLKSLV
ncbi:MAG: zinc metalloprotease HtpX [Candidatus Diapherotrites archaeon]|nr:zinc metalloprotease HtpX [Candidatus Diapherotrites archaeon]